MQARIVVLHSHLLQLSHVQHLQHEAVRPISLEEVAQLLPQPSPTRIAVGAEDGDEDVGVGARSFLVARDDDNLVLDGHQAAGLAGKALDGFGALEGQEVVSLR